MHFRTMQTCGATLQKVERPPLLLHLAGRGDRICRAGILGLALTLLVSSLAAGGEEQKRLPDPQRGREALLTRAYLPVAWSEQTYHSVWKVWGLSEKPADFEERFRDRYGLHPAPYPNDGLPMGLRYTRGLLGRGITVDCLLCHAGSLFGQSIIGLGNASLDMQALFEEMFAAQGVKQAAPFPFTQVRGTTEGAMMSVYLLRLRDEELRLVAPHKFPITPNLCEDAPAWWLLKKKRTMYHTGSTDARSVRSIMQFVLNPLNGPDYIKSLEPTFADIHAFIRSLEPPKYPFAIDRNLAEKGRRLFEKHCASCHGTYGPNGSYPNRVIPLKEIGTDPWRVQGIPREAKEFYARSWFGQERDAQGQPLTLREEIGYQAPPLDGIWATAPYLHNGSVPTVYHVLNSKSRPKIFVRSYRTGVEDYDPVRLGWKFQELDRPPGPEVPAIERRKVYDTSQPGRSNAGHTYGDHLSESDRFALLEYLKTL
ncbi:MAG: c-type cytochrome [Gemmatales bacterium]|nr:c-type cytochrome [Gemmatales bacterium]MDW8223525.1 c-type cytochrome [Gemmatales bacterium]